jgi:hypothetical protein
MAITERSHQNTNIFRKINKMQHLDQQLTARNIGVAVASNDNLSEKRGLSHLIMAENGGKR